MRAARAAPVARAWPPSTTTRAVEAGGGTGDPRHGGPDRPQVVAEIRLQQADGVEVHPPPFRTQAIEGEPKGRDRHGEVVELAEHRDDPRHEIDRATQGSRRRRGSPPDGSCSGAGSRPRRQASRRYAGSRRSMAPKPLVRKRVVMGAQVPPAEGLREDGTGRRSSLIELIVAGQADSPRRRGGSRNPGARFFGGAGARPAPPRIPRSFRERRRTSCRRRPGRSCRRPPCRPRSSTAGRRCRSPASSRRRA